VASRVFSGGDKPLTYISDGVMEQLTATLYHQGHLVLGALVPLQTVFL
jgi:hypothetical protein